MDRMSWQESRSFDRDAITTWPSDVSVIEKEARKAALECGDVVFVLGKCAASASLNWNLAGSRVPTGGRVQ